MSSSEPDTWFRFVRAHRCLIREIERRLAAAGLPAYAWYDALWGLESGPDGARRMSELADVMAIERYNLTRLVDRLEAEGLVTRSRASDDGRGAYAAITERGKVLRKRCGTFTKGRWTSCSCHNSMTHSSASSVTRWSERRLQRATAGERADAGLLMVTDTAPWPVRHAPG